MKTDRKMTVKSIVTSRRKTYDRRLTKALHVTTAFRNPSRVLTAHQSRVDSAFPSRAMSVASRHNSLAVKPLDVKRSNYPNSKHSIYIYIYILHIIFFIYLFRIKNDNVKTEIIFKYSSFI